VIEDFYLSLTLRKPTQSVNSFGQPVKTYTTSTFEGVINKANSTYDLIAGKRTVKVTHNLYCPVNVNITFGDIVVQNSLNYRVVDTPLNTMNKDHHYKISLERIENID
jgi:hypothetical protein